MTQQQEYRIAFLRMKLERHHPLTRAELHDLEVANDRCFALLRVVLARAGVKL